MKSLSILFALSLTLAVFSVAGCSNDSSSESPTAGPETSGPPNTVDDHAGHSHPSEGPHHGELIELGNEEFHAEILHDEDAGSVTIYILNGAATEQVPIDATDVTINARHAGKPEQFKLTAQPDTDDPQGKSSRFVSTDEDLAHHLDEEGAEPRLVLTINGKSYRGVISHDHDHEAHVH